MQSRSSGSFRALRVLAVAGLVAAGMALALPFRLRPHSPSSSQAHEGVVDVPLRRPDVTPEVGPPGTVSPASALVDGEPAQPYGERGVRPDLAALGPPPELAGDFGAAGLGPRPVVMRDWKPVRLKLPEARPKERRHRLTDGDTLERLAERYLNSPARADEIFAINRDLLAAPDLLPLGKIIRIPPDE